MLVSSISFDRNVFAVSTISFERSVFAQSDDTSELSPATRPTVDVHALHDMTKAMLMARQYPRDCRDKDMRFVR
jgi:hypothetical protein